MSFASGLADALSSGITSKGDFIRERVEEERRHLRTQGLQRQAAVSQQRTAYETAAQSLLRRGANRDLVLGQLEQDPQGLLEVYHASSDVTSGEAINSVFNLNEEYSGATLSEILGKVLPTASALPANASPAQARERTLASFLGLDMEEELNEQVYRSQIVGGMTGDDILATAGQPVQARGSGSTTLNLEALQPDRPLTAREVNLAHGKLNMEYSAELQDRINDLQAQIDILPPAEAAELSREKRRLEAILSETGVSARLGLLMKEQGISAAAQELYDAQPEMFTDIFGANIIDLFTSAEEEVGEDNPVDVSSKRPRARPVVEADVIEQVEKAFEEAFTEDPDLDEATIVVDGQSFTSPNLDKLEELERVEREEEETRGRLDTEALAARVDIPKGVLAAGPAEVAEVIEDISKIRPRARPSSVAPDTQKETLSVSVWEGTVSQLVDNGFSVEEAEALLTGQGYSKEDS